MNALAPSRSRRAGILLALYAIVASPSVADASSGALDPDFGSGGTLSLPIGAQAEEAFGVALQPDGRIVVAGYAVESKTRFAVARLLDDGTPDPEFNTSGKLTFPIGTVHDSAQALVLQEDGGIVLGGYSRTGGTDDFALARILPAGTLDPDFGTGGKVVTRIVTRDDRIRALQIDSEGRILAAGYARNSANRDVALARYLDDGSLDETFGDAGTVVLPIGTGNDEAAAIALRPDGRIVVGGHAGDGSQHDMLVLQLTADGDPDVSFNGTGWVRIGFDGGDSFGHALLLQADGGAIVVGTTRIGTADRLAMARITDTGELDGAFGAGGKVTTAIGAVSVGQAILQYSPGSLLVGGKGRDGGKYNFAVAHYRNDGSLIPRFAGVGFAMYPIGSQSDEVRAMALQEDGKVVLAGGTRSSNNLNFGVARVHVDSCGDGFLDAGEECELAEGACCTEACTLAPADTVCRAASDACDVAEACDGLASTCPVDERLPDGDADGVCDAQDVCPTVADPAQTDSDGDELGDACDPCTNGPAFTSSSLRIADFTTPGGDDTLVVKGRMMFPATPVLAPEVNGFRLVITDGTGTALHDVRVPGGRYDAGTRTGWRINGGRTRFNFRTPNAIDGLVNKVKITARSVVNPGLVVVKITGRNGAFAQLPLELPLQSTMVLEEQAAIAGLCADTGFSAGSTPPSCAFDEDVTTLLCS